MSGIELTRLVCRRRTACKGKQLVRIVKTWEITDLGNDDRAESIADPRHGKSGRIDGIHDLFDLCLDLGNFCVQFMNQLDGMSELQWFCRKIWADRTACRFTDFVCFLSAEMSFGCSGKQSRQMLQIGRCDLMSAGELGKKRINGFCVKCWNKPFKLRKQDIYKAGNRLFQLWSVRNFIKSVSG